MSELQHEKEPLDMRLLMLRLLRQLKWIALIVLLSVLIFGGGYYLKNVTLAGKQYRAESWFSVEYVTPPGQGGYYINGTSWDTWMRTREFLDMVYGYLEGTADAGIDREVMKSYLSAYLQSDLTMPNTWVTTPDPELSLRIAGAVEKAMVDFAGKQELIVSIRVVDPAVTTVSFNTARPLNACVLSALLGGFLAVILFVIYELSADSIWLPRELGVRCGCKCLGTVGDPYFAENARYVLGEKDQTGLLPVTEDIDCKEVQLALAGACAGEEKQWIVLPSPSLCPETAGQIRQLDALVLLVKAGSRAGRRLERVMEYLADQDCPVTAAVLCDADERLIRAYYWGERRSSRQGGAE